VRGRFDDRSGVSSITWSFERQTMNSINLATLMLMLLRNQGGLAAPTAPTGLAVTAAVSGDVADLTPEFTWNAVSGADTYEIEYATTLTGTPTADGIAVAAYTAPTDLTNFTAYSVKVRARNGGGVSAWSDAVTFTPKVYLLRVEFATDDASPLTTPYAGEVGSLTITDTGNVLSVSTGNLRYTNAIPAMAAIGLQGAALSRAAGRALTARYSAIVTAPAFPVPMGWWKNTNLNYTGSVNFGHAFYTEGGAWFAGPITLNRAFSVDTLYRMALVLKSSGALYFLKGGVFTDWTLVWEEWIENTASVYPTLAPVSITTYATIAYDYMRAGDLPAPFASDDAIASINVASPSNATEYTGTANAITQCTLTAPAGSITTEAYIKYRKTDANNYWRKGFNTAGAFRVDSVAAGTPTNRTSVAAVIAAGNVRTVRAVTDGNLHDHYSLASSTWTKRGSQLNLSHSASAATVELDLGAGWTAANLRSYPLTSPQYAILDNV
jgi:hypothetical protein